LINTSPDLARQIESCPELQPRGDALRNSPIAGVLLTNADLDHCLGLLLMRQQATPLAVYATGKTQAALDWIDIVLKPFCRIEWRKTAGDFQSLGNGIAYRAIELGKSIAFQLRDEISAKSRPNWAMRFTIRTSFCSTGHSGATTNCAMSGRRLAARER
jgi:pyrroloquinoline quinone biosynthesis protein B